MILTNGEWLLKWPLDGHIITAGWYYSDGSLHRAIDLRASMGTPVYAAFDGTVDWVQKWDGTSKTGNQSYGNLVRIKADALYKGNPVQCLYAHLFSARVSVGDHVTEGQRIGLTGNTGNSTGPHLHFEVRLAGSRVNPLNWLDGDFLPANGFVRLGTFISVEVPDPVQKLQLMFVSGDTEKCIELAEKAGLPVTDISGKLIGPASEGDAVKIWQQALSDGCRYFASYTEE